MCQKGCPPSTEVLQLLGNVGCSFSRLLAIAVLLFSKKEEQHLAFFYSARQMRQTNPMGRINQTKPNPDQQTLYCFGAPQASKNCLVLGEEGELDYDKCETLLVISTGLTYNGVNPD